MGERMLILDPTNAAVTSTVAVAPRLNSLDGKVIGLLDNSKLNADRFIVHLQATLQRRHPATTFLVRRKAGASSVAAAEILDELAERCDAVVAAVGD